MVCQVRAVNSYSLRIYRLSGIIYQIAFDQNAATAYGNFGYGEILGIFITINIRVIKSSRVIGRIKRICFCPVFDLHDVAHGGVRALYYIAHIPVDGIDRIDRN